MERAPYAFTSNLKFIVIKRTAGFRIQKYGSHSTHRTFQCRIQLDLFILLLESVGLDVYVPKELTPVRRHMKEMSLEM